MLTAALRALFLWLSDRRWMARLALGTPFLRRMPLRYRLRIHVPYGTGWYPYFMRRLAERPANVMFVIRSVLGERS